MHSRASTSCPLLTSSISSQTKQPGQSYGPHEQMFQAIEKLAQDTQNPGAGRRPKAKAIISCVEQGAVPFKSEMGLDGKVEEYMNLIIDKMRSELKLHCFRAMRVQQPEASTQWCPTGPPAWFGG